MANPEASAPIDTNVTVPESVRRAVAAAAAAHKQAYGDQPAPDAPAAPVVPLAPVQPIVDTGDKQINITAAEPPKAPVVPAQAQTPPATPPQTPIVPDQVQPTAPPVSEESYQHRYNSMRGRFEQAQGTIASMQQQMQEMGDELQRVHALLQQRGPVPSSGPATPTRNLTDEDRNAYGADLTEFVMKAAKDAVAPELNAVEQENLRLRQQVNRQAQNTMYGALRASVPDWETINRNPRFIQWLRLPDVYSGQVRSAMLKQAFQAANAPRVIAFFKGFVDDEVATGHVVAPQHQPALQLPREPAVQLQTLAAPGPARPASGDTQVPDAKPVYTRQYIKGFYDQVRAGLWAGREADKARLESDIFAAQREGRVR